MNQSQLSIQSGAASLMVFSVPTLGARPGLEYYAYVADKKQQWGEILPTAMLVVEFHGQGDLAFGGRADDRVLTADGHIANAGEKNEPAVFKTIEDAHLAALKITNRRPNSLLGVVPQWKTH